MNRHRGIAEPDILAFDVANPDLDDPGMSPEAPYHREHVKATAIWITGGRSFAEGRTHDPLMALIPRLLNPAQYTAILDLLGW